MKVRRGFVSNSSSSSYTCEVCNETHSGWDLCIDDAGMFECENGHIIHEDCSKTFEHPSRESFEDEDAYYEYRYGVSSIMCPICTLEVIPDQEVARYLLNKYDLRKEDIKKEIREEFDSLNDMWLWRKK